MLCVVLCVLFVVCCVCVGCVCVCVFFLTLRPHCRRRLFPLIAGSLRERSRHGGCGERVPLDAWGGVDTRKAGGGQGGRADKTAVDALCRTAPASLLFFFFFCLFSLRKSFACCLRRSIVCLRLFTAGAALELLGVGGWVVRCEFVSGRWTVAVAAPGRKRM